jgi:hypothetical protein
MEGLAKFMHDFAIDAPNVFSALTPRRQGGTIKVQGDIHDE